MAFKTDEQRQSSLIRPLTAVGMGGLAAALVTEVVARVLGISHWFGVAALTGGLALVTVASGAVYLLVLALLHYPELDRLRYRLYRSANPS